MDTRTTLLTLAAALVVAAAVGVAAVPGAIDDPRVDDGPERPGHLSLADVVVEPGEVRGGTAELRLLTDVEHRGSTVENVTVRYRAIDAASGLLVDETVVDVGDVGADTPRDASRERTVEGSLDVERAGAYRIETVVYADGERRTAKGTRVSGVSALTPGYADSPVGFTDGDVWPTVGVGVVESDPDAGTATLEISASVTNRGDDPSADLEFRLVLRQAESNVVADEATADLGSVRPGRTDTVTVTVEVPDGYNYYVDAALFDDDVLIDETRSVANLDPRETIRANETVEDVEFSVEEFAEEDADAEEPRPAPDEERDTGDETPGFGAVVAVLAIVAAALYAGRGGGRRP